MPSDVAGRPGEGVRNVLSVIEPVLAFLSKPPGLPRPLVAPLFKEVLEDRLCILLVCTSATEVGGGDIARSAAAAADADKLP